MKKVITGLFVLAVFVATSCTERTCPTYAKVKVEKPVQEEIISENI